MMLCFLILWYLRNCVVNDVNNGAKAFSWQHTLCEIERTVLNLERVVFFSGLRCCFMLSLPWTLMKGVLIFMAKHMAWHV